MLYITDCHSLDIIPVAVFSFSNTEKYRLVMPEMPFSCNDMCTKLKSQTMLSTFPTIFCKLHM